jgi:hypothetical protein
MRWLRASSKAVLLVLTVVLCSGPLYNCECSDDRFLPPQLEVEPTVLQFDDVAVGYPQERTLKITNLGKTGLLLEKVDVRGGSASPFSVIGVINPTTKEVDPVPGSVGPDGHFVELVVQYDPQSETANDFDTLEIMTNDPDDCPSQQNQCEVQLNGTGAPPDADLTVVCQSEELCPPPDGSPVCRVILDATNEHPIRLSFNFCTVPQDSRRELKALLQNTGNIPLEMDGFWFNPVVGDHSDFRLLEPKGNIVIQPGRDQMLTLIYLPSEQGVDNTGITIKTTDYDLQCCSTACSDQDGDGYGIGSSCLGPDCNESDSGCNDGACCADCIDMDGDGYGNGIGCLGGDCNDTDVNCWDQAPPCCRDYCVDLDNDGYGRGISCNGPDCNDSDPACNTGNCCLACFDLDGDGSGSGSNCEAADCDDSDFACQNDNGFRVRLLGFSDEPDIQVTPENIPFTGVTQGSSDTKPITVHNTGNATLVVHAIEVSGGSNPGEFTVDKTELTVLGGSQDTVNVTYSPQDGGQDDGSVTFFSNDPDEGIVAVTLGAEVRPDLEVVPDAIVEFIDVLPGETATPQDVTMRNIGYADLTIDNIEFNPNNNPGDPPVFGLDFGGPPPFPLILAPSDSYTFKVTFTDNTMIEDELGQLEIFHDSPNDSLPYILFAASTGTPANLPPVALIDPPAKTQHGLDPVSLDGTQSFDPDDPPDYVDRYLWSFLFVPTDLQGNQSQATLDSTDQPTTSFTPDITGIYIVRLVVFDSFGTPSRPTDAEISVNP